jgi:energy-coupling factor transporter ATP-binding protein EcfA2
VSATGTCSDEALDDDRIDYLIRDARASVLSSSDVADELESVGLDLVAGERIADAAIEDAVASFGEDLAGIAELKAELQAADAALKAESTTPRLVVYPAVLVLLAMIGLSGLTIVGLGGLAVTAIEGHGRWILPWFGLHSALIGIAICVALFSLLGLLLTRQERRTAASPGARRVSSLESQISAKQKTIREILTQEWIRPAIREAVNRAREPSWSTELTLRSAEGLGQPLNPQLEIDTAVRHAVERRLTLWSGGSIGIAGPRGVGKSTLIETLCRSEPQEDGRKRLGVIVAAPVSYEPRDFILYLFATVCEKVLETYELPAPKLVDLIAEPAAARKGNQMTLSSFMRRLAQVTFEVVTVNTSVTVGRRVQPPPYTPVGVGDTAGELLQEIRFQQTFTAGWGGSLSSPIGFKLDRGQSFARASMTLPEVVTRLREFLEQLGVEHQVVVGIDELDKIAGEAEAQRFLNDISVRSTRQCDAARFDSELRSVDAERAQGVFDGGAQRVVGALAAW